MDAMIDVIVIGAGLGGLMAASKLAGAGKQVLVVEKRPLPGGTSYIFQKGGYAFPMGPLSFSFPERVRGFLREAGIGEKISFRRQGFELRTPDLDVMMSRPLAAIQAELGGLFPEERAGLLRFFRRLESTMAASRDIDRWHPDYSVPAAAPAKERPAHPDPHRVAEVRRHSRLPAAEVLDRLIMSVPLRNFLGSLGTDDPEMSMLGLASMWNIMADEGIWYPSCGVHGITDLFMRRLLECGAEVRLGTSVKKILVHKGRVAGIVTEGGEVLESRWVVSNADYKATFLELLDAGDVPIADLSAIRDVPYTGSEFCIYLGLRPREVDLRAFRAEHLIYRHEVRDAPRSDPEDFDDREIELCLWSRKAPELAPPDRAALLLRARFPIRHFEKWSPGPGQRGEGYPEYKKRLAGRLIKTAERILPGLSGAVEVMETATPLTYRDEGSRYEGSIAGWSWSGPDSARLPGKLLVQSPVPGLLMAGVYAASELFLGGVPTALYTGSLAADIVLAG
jgi:phytoene dehydrogenase-like protein